MVHTNCWNCILWRWASPLYRSHLPPSIFNKDAAAVASSSASLHHIHNLLLLMISFLNLTPPLSSSNSMPFSSKLALLYHCSRFLVLPLSVLSLLVFPMLNKSSTNFTTLKSSSGIPASDILPRPIPPSMPFCSSTNCAATMFAPTLLLALFFSMPVSNYWIFFMVESFTPSWKSLGFTSTWFCRMPSFIYMHPAAISMMPFYCLIKCHTVMLLLGIP